MLLSYPLTADALAELRTALTPTRYTAHREPERARDLRTAAASLPAEPGHWMPPADHPLRRTIACELTRRARIGLVEHLTADQTARLADLTMAEEHRADLADLLTGPAREV